MDEVKLVGCRFSLRRERDGAGDSGPSWNCFDAAETVKQQKYIWVDNTHGLIKVGYGIRCGSITARSYSAQDWWQCSGVTEILDVIKNTDEEIIEVKFKTGNSVYIATSC